MDLQISRWIVNQIGTNEGLATFIKILTYGGSKWFIMGLVGILLIFKKTRKIGINALFACLLTYLLNDFAIKLIVKRPRPFEADTSLGAICELAGLELPSGYSMASGHAAVSMALAVSIFMFSWKLGIPALIYSLLVGFSRVFLCVHYFTDVLVGFVVGTIVAATIYFAIGGIKKYYSKRKKQNEKNSNSVTEQGQDQGVSGDTQGV